MKEILPFSGRRSTQMNTLQRLATYGYEEEQSEDSEEGVDSQEDESSDEEDALTMIGPRSGVPVECAYKMPRNLPFVQPYEGGDFFFVRKCYDIYYVLVEKLLLEGRRCVTLTGTRGIGKSIFYAYFFDRFRREHRGEGWIIVASSYGNSGEIREMAVFEEGKEPNIIRVATPEVLLKMAQRLAGVYVTEDGEWRGDGDNKKVLYLCDGPPAVTYTHAVVFTYPNDRWLADAITDECTYWMPPWRLEELQLAASVLNCPVSDDEIEERFWNFGGVAQNCLRLNPTCIQKAITQLTIPIERISARSQIQDLLCRSNMSDIRHCLLHYEPTDAGGMVMTRKLVSKMVCEKISQRVVKLTDGSMKKVDAFLLGIPFASPLRECTFKAIAHATLQRGPQLKARLLSHGESRERMTTFTISESPESDAFEIDGLSSSLLNFGRYHKPKLDIFESIDGFYFPATTARSSKSSEPTKQIILFFQITASKQRRVHASEIIYVLMKLGLLDQVKESPMRAAIIFLQPEVDTKKLKRQGIFASDGSPPRLTRDIEGIGPRTVKTLTEQYKVTTVAELAAMVGPFKQGKIEMVDSKHGADWSRAVRSWEMHVQHANNPEYIEMVERIPQYVSCAADNDNKKRGTNNKSCKEAKKSKKCRTSDDD